MSITTHWKALHLSFSCLFVVITKDYARTFLLGKKKGKHKLFWFWIVEHTCFFVGLVNLSCIIRICQSALLEHKLNSHKCKSRIKRVTGRTVIDSLNKLWSIDLCRNPIRLGRLELCWHQNEVRLWIEFVVRIPFGQLNWSSI